MKDISDFIRGSMWGLALGDALGKPIEFKQLIQIKEFYGPKGITKMPRNAIWTDDTEMTFAVARTLINTHHLSVEEISTQIADEFINWLDNPGYAPGNTCRMGVFKYKNDPNKKWWESGIKNSKGCGSAMRVAPIGLYFSDLDKLYKVAYNSSIITHAHPTAIAAAVGAAYLVRLALNKIEVNLWPGEVKKFVKNVPEPGRTEFCNAIDTAVNVLRKENTEEAIRSIGKGWVGEEAVGIALYCCLKYPEPTEFKKMLILSVNHDGDSDSTGCIAGGIMGTFHGYNALGKEIHEWTERFMEKERMDKIINNMISSLKN
ncbi:MAG: ADP-ribosylglycohydrolase family protein [Candidatus Helarchaeota archaeon]|nr:ADP-ribosylglycohydrolase family protein [Candidatus Helarchaeota archaeon]